MSDLEGKVDEVKKIKGELGIIGVTETWAKKDEVYNLKGYNAYRNDREDGQGGTILYVKTGRTEGMPTT